VIYGNDRDRNYHSFVESPTRGAPNTAREVLVGNGPSNPIPVIDPSEAGEAFLVYGEINSVAQNSSGTSTAIVVPAGKKIKKIKLILSGNNRAVFSLIEDASKLIQTRIGFTNFGKDVSLDYYEISSGAEVKIEVLNLGHGAGDFNYTLEGLLYES
jgi:hypothetical protein